MKEAMYYEKDGQVISCVLCPHNCKLKEGMAGRCKVRKVMDGKLYSINYGEISALNVDPIEKKPIGEWKSGSHILSIGSFGCNFHCDFCQNHNISMNRPYTVQLSPEEIVNKAIELGVPSIAYTYNEPTIYYEFMWDTAKLAKEKGLNNVIVTNGFIETNPWLNILEYIDAVNIDLKTYRDDYYKKLGGTTVDIILRTIEEAVKKCHVEISMLIVPGISDDPDRMEAIFKKLKSIDKDLVLHISRYFPMHNYHEDPTDIDIMKSIRDRALKYFDKVFLGNVR